MEITALFRPHTKIENGLIKYLQSFKNEFFCSEENNLILLLGKEPNLQWRQYVDCIFSLCNKLGVKKLYFIGSVAGLVPHTREPKIFCTVSQAELKESFSRYGIKFSNYEGPASIITYLLAECEKQGLNMASLVATIPAYVQGNNPRCIEAVIKRLASILGLQIKLDELQDISDEFEKKLTNVVQEQPERLLSWLGEQPVGCRCECRPGRRARRVPEAAGRGFASVHGCRADSYHDDQRSRRI